VSRKPARRRPQSRTSPFAPARTRGARIVGTVARIAAFVVLLYLAGLAWFVVSRPGPAPLTQATDAVVVLTGGPGRLARGAEVLAAGSAKRMLVSGVGKGVSRAALASSVAAPHRRFATLVDLGYDADDTRSNAVETSAWVARHGYRSIRLVTSSAHMRRARLELSQHLPPSVRIVEDGVPGAGPGGVAREFNKYLLRRAALAAGAA
jgi:uncharacterized SAM-binding protein YcdF (DUF218 family)